MLYELLIFSLLFGSLGAWIIVRFAGKLALIDCPNHRSSHHQPTPKGGGIGILAAFWVAAMVLGVSIWIWMPMIALSLIAGYGDRVELAARTRLILQLGLMALFVMIPLQPIPENSSFLLMVLFWIVFIAGTANFYNFMDGINGIAGITGAVAFSLLAYYIYSFDGRIILSNLALCIAFSCIGFLPFNVPEARVFMGDVGSILLGSVFAGLVYLTSRTILDFLCMTSFLFPFYADELTTMAVRLRRGEDLTRAHRKHVYQILANEKGMPHWRVSLGFACLQLIVSMSVLLTRSLGSSVVLPVLILYFIAFAVGSWYLRSVTAARV